MQMPSRSAWTTFIVLVLLFASSGVSAQGRFTVNGRMKIDGADLNGARVVVMKNGTKERTLTKDLNKFTLDLDLNASYVLSFEKDGFVSKKISFNTKAPAAAIANGFTPFDFAVSLFKQYDDINIVVFNQPVGMIRFDEKVGDFDYDTDYTKSIQSQLQQVLEQVEEKQKEEAEGEKAKAAQAAQEAKALAKAEAESAKQEAAKAKAEAEAKKQVETQAKAEEPKKEAPVVTKPKPAPEKEKVEAAASKPEPSTPAPTAKPKPPPMERPITTAVATQVRTGGDERRMLEPVVAMETPRTAMARVQVSEESRPVQEQEEHEVVRSEELTVESNKVTVVVTMALGDQKDEYRKTVHKWGGHYYFKNGLACSEELYERETAAEQLAGATPRGKLDR